MILRQIYLDWSLVHVLMRLLLANRLLLQSYSPKLLLKLLFTLIFGACACTWFLLSRLHSVLLALMLLLLSRGSNHWFSRLDSLLLILTMIPLGSSSWPNIHINSTRWLVWLVEGTSYRWLLLGQDLLYRASSCLSHVVVQLGSWRFWIIEDLLGASRGRNCRSNRHLFLLFDERYGDLLSLTKMSSLLHVFFQGWAFLSPCSMLVYLSNLLNVDGLILKALFVVAWRTSSVESWWVYLNRLLECLVARVSNLLSRWSFLIKELLHEQLNSPILLLLSTLSTSRLVNY